MHAQKSSYESTEGAKSFLSFLNSKDGQFHQKILGEIILNSLKNSPKLKILDAGCASGWLSGELAKQGHQVKGCDISLPLLNIAKKQFPQIDFTQVDLNNPLPYETEEFDCVVMSMSTLDLKNLKNAFFETKRILKNQGGLKIVTLNPYYGFPVASWKRGFWGKLLGKKPELKLKEYFTFKNSQSREFIWNKNLVSYFYTLPEQINLILSLGFKLKNIQDVESKEDNANFGLKYRLHRFPIFVFLEFEKEKVS